MLRSLAPLALVACTSTGGSGGLGTVAYVDGNGLRLLDVSSYDDVIVDPSIKPSTLFDVAIAPDAMHVAYTGNTATYLADRAGGIATLELGYRCPLGWTPQGTLIYCNDGGVLIVTPGTPPRFVGADRVDVSSDGGWLAYKEARPGWPVGDIVVERIDGSERRVISPAGAPTYVVRFTPDASALLVLGGGGDADWRRIRLSDLSELALGTLRIAEVVPGMSEFSRDGRTVLMTSETEFLAVDLDTGARRVLATSARAQYIGYIGDALVYQHAIDMSSPGSDVRRSVESIRMIGGGLDRELVAAPPLVRSHDLNLIAADPVHGRVLTAENPGGYKLVDIASGDVVFVPPAMFQLIAITRFGGLVGLDGELVILDGGARSAIPIPSNGEAHDYVP